METTRIGTSTCCGETERTHVFLRGDDGSEEPISYGRLHREASAVASGLRERGIRPGDTVSLMLPTGLDFLRSFFGILMARAVPVPIYPPVRLDRLEEYATRQAGILADAGARLLVTISRARPVAGLLRPAVPTLDAVVTADELAQGTATVKNVRRCNRRRLPMENCPLPDGTYTVRVDSPRPYFRHEFQVVIKQNEVVQDLPPWASFMAMNRAKSPNQEDVAIWNASYEFRN